MIDCVTIATAHCFPGNLIAAQHRLRYQEVIAKEDWSDIYVADEMEFDRYDNVATEYFIARNSEGDVLGVSRSYPTTIPHSRAYRKKHESTKARKAEGSRRCFGC